ncbi:MAG: hypothetical protein NTU98_03155 [Bacteroidetes bacterium]|nr:hypothetical protein [Bacteroidota bacterium]
MNIKITPSSVFRILLMIIAILLVADIAGFLCRFYFDIHYLNSLVRLFDLDQETNIPSYYSDLSLLASSLLLFFISYSHRGKKDFLPWFGLAVAFAYLSFDEACMFHEMLIGIFHRGLHTSGLFYDAWVIPYGIVLVVGAIVYLPFLARLPRRTMILFVISGIIYVSGAIGVEMFQGKYEEIHGTQKLVYSVTVAIEEFMEMFGVALFIYALLGYISLTPDNLTLTVTDKSIRD